MSPGRKPWERELKLMSFLWSERYVFFLKWSFVLWTIFILILAYVISVEEGLSVVLTPGRLKIPPQRTKPSRREMCWVGEGDVVGYFFCWRKPRVASVKWKHGCRVMSLLGVRVPPTSFGCNLLLGFKEYLHWRCGHLGLIEAVWSTLMFIPTVRVLYQKILEASQILLSDFGSLDLDPYFFNIF